MQPKSGKAGSIVPPAEPEEALEADKAEAGQVSRPEADTVEPHRPKLGETPVGGEEGGEKESEELVWIEVKLVDQDGVPVAGEAYKVTLPDGKVDSGTLDHEGFVRIEGIPPGDCQVTFPNLDGSSWQKA
jgi:hypothetical protein